MLREPHEDPHYDEYREETNRYRRPIKRNYDPFYPDAYFEADNTPEEEEVEDEAVSFLPGVSEGSEIPW